MHRAIRPAFEADPDSQELTIIGVIAIDKSCVWLG
jgi:hypothetical protein